MHCIGISTKRDPTRVDDWLLGLGLEAWRVMATAHEVAFGDANGPTTLSILKTIVYFKWVNFMICKLSQLS